MDHPRPGKICIRPAKRALSSLERFPGTASHDCIANKRLALLSTALPRVPKFKRRSWRQKEW
eukprot:9527268-Alexandrium_andersonii.AAC.1